MMQALKPDNLSITGTSPGRGTNPRGLHSVLVARFSALGDVAMTIPVLYSACACYPDVKFTFITRRSMTPIFLNTPENLSVIGLDLSNGYHGVKGLWQLFRKLRKEVGFDALIDLHDVLRTKIFGIFCRIHGIPVAVINKGRRGKRALTRRHHKMLLPLTSSRARYRQAFHSMGLPVENRFHGLFGYGKGNPELFSHITPPKAVGETWVGIAPFAKHEGKIYPTELMEQVIAELAGRKGVKIFLFGGGGGEAEILNRWAEKYGDSVQSLAGKKFGFPVELALVSWLDVMVSMDSANMHLTSLVRTPVISVWGATHPYCGFKGWRQREDDIIQLPMTCRPCSVFGNKPCFRGDHLCMRGIAPSMIIERIDRNLHTDSQTTTPQNR